MTHEELIDAINNCSSLEDLEKLIDIALERARERLEKYEKYIFVK